MRKKTKQLNIRLTESEFARLTKNARKADLTMTCYLGMLINGYSPREKPDLDFIDLMSRLSDLAQCYRNLVVARRTSVSNDTIAIPSTAEDNIEWQQQIEKLTRIIMEIQPEVAHAIGVKLANELWGDRFQVLVATHLDINHLHNHFVINSVSYADGKKYNDCSRAYYQMSEAERRGLVFDK